MAVKSSKLILAARNLLVTSVAIVLIALVIDYFSFPSYPSVSTYDANKGLNGLWLQYYWYRGKHSAAEHEEMVKRLVVNEIKYAYFHVLSIDRIGALEYHELENAKRINKLVHEKAPGVQSIAWVYVGSVPLTGPVDLSRPEVRKKMVAEALWLVNECGFDGIQWDYEVCKDGDRGFIKLMEETRSALPSGKVLSCATPLWYLDTRFGWGDAYFSEVAKHADQLVVMCYDSFILLPRSYCWLVMQQVLHVGKAVKSNPNCVAIFGLPTYEDVTISHIIGVETLANGFRGLFAGLTDKSANKAQVAGVALFADYTTDAKEWAEYRQWWLRK